jgi:hypothetical protein
MIRRCVNTLVGYATRPGAPALGSTAAGVLSPFTKSLAAHIGKPGLEFAAIYRHVIREVRHETQNAQDPGLILGSVADLYLLPTDQIRALQREAWLAALSSNRRGDIQLFSEWYSVSRHAAAARQWLEDNATDPLAPQFTRLSPAAVERAWRPGEARVAVGLPLTGVAFERSLDQPSAEAIQRLDDRALGIVSSSTKSVQATAPRLAEERRSLVAHRTVVATREFAGHASPSPTAGVTTTIPAGTVIRLRGVAGAGSLWVEASVPGTERPVYLQLGSAQDASATVDLGLPLREVILPPHPNVRALVESSELRRVIGALRESGRTILWASVATATADEAEETEARTGRRTHVEYLLRRAGIDGRRITAVAAADDMSGAGVRIRFFGY